MDWEYLLKKTGEFIVIIIVPIGTYSFTRYCIPIKNSFSFRWKLINQFKTIGIIAIALFLLGVFNDPSPNNYLLTAHKKTEDTVLWFLLLYLSSLFATIDTIGNYSKKNDKQIEELKIKEKIKEKASENINDY